MILDPPPRDPPPPIPLAARPLRKSSSVSSSTSSAKNAKKNKQTLTILVPHVAKLGLRLQQDKRHVVVRHISPESVFADTDLRPGMRILAMNDYDCVGCNVEEVSHLFRQDPRPDGLLTLVVQQPSSSSLSLSNDNRQRSHGSSSSSSSSSFSSAKENQHANEDEFATATNVAIPGDLHERFQRYKSARGSTATTTSSASACSRSSHAKAHIKKKSSSSNAALAASAASLMNTVRASIVKSSSTQSTGIRLKESPDRQAVRIDRMAPDSPFGRTALAVGMTVQRVNGIDCTGLTVQQVAQLIRETQGTLTIEAFPANGRRPPANEYRRA